MHNFGGLEFSASSITRDRIRSTTIQPMSLQRSLIAHDHRPILDRLPSRIRFATGTAARRNVRGLIRLANPIPANPISSTAHVEGSGMAEVGTRKNEFVPASGTQGS